MTDEGDSMAAKLLSVSTAAYAACASNRFLEKRPDAANRLGESAFGSWKDHFGQRIRELSVAIAEKEPSLFLSRIRWSRASFNARQVPEELLRDSLVCLSEVLEEELPSGFCQLPKKYIEAALSSLDKLEKKAGGLGLVDPSSKLAMQFLVQVLEGDSRGAIKMVVDSHANGLSVEETFGALMSAQNEIGRMWHEAEVNIAEEHLVTSTTKRAMAVLAYQCERQPSNGLTVVAAAVKGNSHDTGAQVLTDFFELAGWRAICLGGDLPAIEIAEAVTFFDSSLVLLSAALSIQLKAVRESINAIRELGTSCKIMVGGTAFHDAPDIWRQMGADAYAFSPSEAIATGLRLVNG